jgi:LETM1 and EF-hand domain-containing protein 1, mitochondrial
LYCNNFKVREQGGSLTNADLFKYIKLFEDEFTIDYMGMSMLRAMCRILGISTLGTPEILRFRLNMKLRELKADDKVFIYSKIQYLMIDFR